MASISAQPSRPGPAARTNGQRSGERSGISRLEAKLAARQAIVLDGAIGTELVDVLPGEEERLSGGRALLAPPGRVLDVHRRYVEAGCDVIATDTWALASAIHDQQPPMWASGASRHWMDIARQRVRLARQASDLGGRAGETTVAFSLNGDIDSPEGRETIALLDRVFDEDPPDLILVETLSLVQGSLYATVDSLLETGLPVWLSFRRCRHGLCGVYGQHWGGPEGDGFGRAARRFEEMGVAALLVNCVPPDHVTGMIPWLRDFTDLPLGVYPNLGYHTRAGWRFNREMGADEYAALALEWRAEGAQIIGGCCGTGPEHLAAARHVLEGTEPGQGREGAEHDAPIKVITESEPWQDGLGRRLYPLEFPQINCEPGVFAPTQGSLLVWRHLFREAVGRGRRCLDVGCGTGLLSVQLALNGATHVHAIDVDPKAPPNTIANAYRNGVGDQITAAVADLYPWVPEERYDVIVASLYQTPVDPHEPVPRHRPLDFWGRNAIDHLINRLPEALAPDGVAYIMQLSIIGMERTVELLERGGFGSRVVDFSFFEFHDLFQEKKDQILRVESLSDAYHLNLGGDDVIIAYLIEVTHKQPSTKAVP